MQAKQSTLNANKTALYTINNHFISFLYAAIIHKPVSFQFQMIPIINTTKFQACFLCIAFLQH